MSSAKIKKECERLCLKKETLSSGQIVFYADRGEVEDYRLFEKFDYELIEKSDSIHGDYVINTGVYE